MFGRRKEPSVWISAARPTDGAHTCARIPACLKRAVKSRALERNLEVPIPQEVLERLAREMEVSHESQCD